MLQNKDVFPSLTFARAGGGEVHLPGDLAGEFGVILFRRGSWCPCCNAQLAAFARAADEFAEEGIRVVSVSVDDREKSEALVAKHDLSRKPRCPLADHFPATSIQPQADPL